ncbi:hypothetical protein J6590_029350 [Homalodisca vitripennis]|nr:hypothetical protein J6590_029350 [Homalodisca vitripennis]
MDNWTHGSSMECGGAGGGCWCQVVTGCWSLAVASAVEILERMHQVTTKQKNMSSEAKNSVLMLCDAIDCLQSTTEERITQSTCERKRTTDVAVQVTPKMQDSCTRTSVQMASMVGTPTPAAKLGASSPVKNSKTRKGQMSKGGRRR